MKMRRLLTSVLSVMALLILASVVLVRPASAEGPTSTTVVRGTGGSAGYTYVMFSPGGSPNTSLSDGGWRVRFSNGFNAPYSIESRERNIYQLSASSGTIRWEVYHVSRPRTTWTGASFNAGRTDLSMDVTAMLYQLPGYHYVGGRFWSTSCEAYSSTIERCRTEIESGGKWVFNNLTYRPSPRSAWKNNPLGGYGKVGYKGTWDSGKWRVECDTASTGYGACRSYYRGTFNNIVLFR